MNLYTYVHNNPQRYTDHDGHRAKGLDFSFSYFTLKYGYELGSLADNWWDGDISDTELLNSVGINFNEWEDIDLSSDKSYDDSAEELKYNDEKNVATVLSMMGKDVKTIKRNSNNTPDFLVDGVRVELKTAYPKDGKLNNKTSTQAAAKGFNEQKASMVILDLRFGVNETPNAFEIFDLYFYTVTKLKRTNANFSLQIWTSEGIYSGIIKLNSQHFTEPM